MSPRLIIVALSIAVLFNGVSSGSAETILSRCTDIRQSGVYSLDRDITGSVGAACLQIRDVANVHLNCHGHSITTDGLSIAAMLVQAAKNFTIESCKLPQLSGYSLFVGNSADGMITKNELKDMVILEPTAAAAKSLRLVGNRFSEFGGAPALPSSSFDNDNGVIPVASGLNEILARQMLVSDVPDHQAPGDTAVAAPAIHPVVFPNPWRRDRHSAAAVTFDRLPPNSTVKIFTVSAHAVKTLHPSTTSVPWDLRNDDGDPVASGLYLYLITTDHGQKAVGQLAVIR